MNFKYFVGGMMNVIFCFAPNSLRKWIQFEEYVFLVDGWFNYQLEIVERVYCNSIDGGCS